MLHMFEHMNKLQSICCSHVVTDHYPMLLTTTINDTMKQGDYILVPDPEKLLVYDALLSTLSWSWNLTQIQGFQYRRMSSEVEITVGRCVSIDILYVLF